MTTSEASQRIQQALARGQLDECLDQFDAAWHEATELTGATGTTGASGAVPSLPKWLAEYGGLADDHFRQQLVGELIKIDLEQRWRRTKSLSSSQAVSQAPAQDVAPDSVDSPAPQYSDHTSGGLPWTAVLEDYARALGPMWPFADLPKDLLAEEYRVRKLWGDAPPHALYRERCPNGWPELHPALIAVDAEIMRSRTSSTVRSNDSSQPTPSESKQIDVRIGDELDDFRILSVLGEGSFAKVFLAQQKSMQRLVALKVTRYCSQESPVLSQLDHPNIVRVYDERTAGPYTLMYMQFVPGDSLRFAVDLRRTSSAPLKGADYVRSLTQALSAKGLASSRRIAESSLQRFQWVELVAWLGSRLFAALAHAHQCAVYHRDVKPENILVTADGEPMLLDFNLSFGMHLEGSSIEKSFGGSLAYMSPEQLSSLLGKSPISSVGAASDVYSMAIVLVELLYGQRPADEDARSPQALLELRSQPLAWPSSGDAGLVAGEIGLRENLLDALQPDPSVRPSAAQLAERLRVCFHSRLCDIYHPRPDSWNAWIASHPLRSLIGFGLLPNICVSIVNIWANDRLTTHNFDRDFFDDVEKPVVNLIAYTLGVVGSLVILTPVLRDLRAANLSLETRQTLAYKTLRTPLLTSMLILFLWIASGLAFPLWNQWSPRSLVGAQDVAGFVISQVIHGVIAAVATLAITSKVVTQAILPKYYTADMPCIPATQFEWCTGVLRWASSIMAVTPLLAVFALAVSDQFDRTVFVVLAIVGFAGHLFTSAFVPQIISKLNALATLCTGSAVAQASVPAQTEPV